MFLPTRIIHPYQRVPYVTNTLLGLNVLAFAFTLTREDFGGLAMNTESFAPHQLITSLFLHAGLLHLLGNMLFLYVYGRYVEERLGPLRYAGAYLLFGVMGCVFFGAFNDGSVVGASGAIAGLMGFVIVGAPWAEVSALFGFYAYVKRVQIAAFWMVGLWIVLQVFESATAGPFSRVAYSAHFGGFLAGCGLAALLRSPICEGTDWWLDPAPPGGGRAATERLRRARGARPKPRKKLTKSGAPAFEVVFESVEEAPSQVEVIKLLMRHRQFAPDQANEFLDAVREGEPKRFAFEDLQTAQRFTDEARALGVQAVLVQPRTRPQISRS